MLIYVGPYKVMGDRLNLVDALISYQIKHHGVKFHKLCLFLKKKSMDLIRFHLEIYIGCSPVDRCIHVLFNKYV